MIKSCNEALVFLKFTLTFQLCVYIHIHTHNIYVFLNYFSFFMLTLSARDAPFHSSSLEGDFSLVTDKYSGIDTNVSNVLGKV